ncbi:MAG: sulfatase-like hydrolase/transferase, partial [Verrucomicrobiales bacterium]
MHRLGKPLAILALFTLAATAQTKRPNFLFILADDQSPFDLKLYNPESELDTPNLDRLAHEGMIIDGAYHMGSWSGAVCMPSRTMIMTGRTVWHLPNYKQAKPPAPGDINDFTLPEMFNKAGYVTMRTCKKGNSYEPQGYLTLSSSSYCPIFHL